MKNILENFEELEKFALQQRRKGMEEALVILSESTKTKDQMVLNPLREKLGKQLVYIPADDQKYDPKGLEEDKNKITIREEHMTNQSHAMREMRYATKFVDGKTINSIE